MTSRAAQLDRRIRAGRDRRSVGIPALSIKKNAEWERGAVAKVDLAVSTAMEHWRKMCPHLAESITQVQLRRGVLYVHLRQRSLFLFDQFLRTERRQYPGVKRVKLKPCPTAS